MPLVADRVKDAGTLTGLGNVTLAGSPPTGYQAFATAFPIGAVVWYCIEDISSGAWEVGFGTLSATLTLTRDTITGSSNANAKVTFGSAVSVNVFCTAAADVIEDANGGRQLALTRNIPLY